jgi:lysophospholipase L1-like esterase
MKFVFLVLVVLVSLLVTLEIGLRSLLGLGKPLIYIADPEIGYLLAPNQQTCRFGKAIAVNQYSMRSSPISPQRPAQTLRILMVGDSIANGGWWTDQSQTIATRLQQSLTTTLPPQKFQQIEVLNASANSWGPRNELAYLQRFGNFEAQIVLLLINTDDLFTPAPTSLRVGQDPNYPDQLPPTALVEAVTRYLLRPTPDPELEAKAQAESGDRVGRNLEAIRQIQQLTQQSQSQFLLVMTPLRREIGSPGPRDYEQVARQRLEQFTQNQQISFIDILPIFNQPPNPEHLYIDTIHLSTQGNQTVIESILVRIKELLHLADPS